MVVAVVDTEVETIGVITGVDPGEVPQAVLQEVPQGGEAMVIKTG